MEQENLVVTEAVEEELELTPEMEEELSNGLGEDEWRTIKWFSKDEPITEEGGE